MKKGNLRLIQFVFTLRRVGGKFSGPCASLWVEALNFLDLFASFLGQAKNEEPARLEGKKSQTRFDIPIFILEATRMTEGGVLCA